MITGKVDRLSINDIWDLREYERRRDDYRSWIIERKRNRRITIGDFITVVFENRDTVKFQVQEMVRAERMIDDTRVQAELDAYNPLIPGDSELSATLFLEFTDEASMREWLPRLIGIERAVQLHIGNRVVSCQPEEEHADMLTRSDVTSSVHYIRFPLDAQDVAALRDSTSHNSTSRNSTLRENGSENEAVSHKMTRHELPGGSKSEGESSSQGGSQGGSESGSQGGSKSEDKGEGGSQSGSESGDESGSQSGSETASVVASDPASVVVLAVDHPAYKASTLLTGETVEELLGDLEGHLRQ